MYAGEIDSELLRIFEWFCLQIRLFWGPSDGVTSWAGQTAGSQLGQTQRAFCFYNPLMLGTTSLFSLT